MKLSPEQVTRVRQLKADGLTYGQIAERVGVKHCSVQYACKKECKGMPKKYSREDALRWRQMRRDGKTYKEIYELEGVASNLVLAKFQEFGV